MCPSGCTRSGLDAWEEKWVASYYSWTSGWHRWAGDAHATANDVGRATAVPLFHIAPRGGGEAARAPCPLRGWRLSDFMVSCANKGRSRKYSWQIRDISPSVYTKPPHVLNTKAEVSGMRSAAQGAEAPLCAGGATPSFPLCPGTRDGEFATGAWLLPIAAAHDAP